MDSPEICGRVVVDTGRRMVVAHSHTSSLFEFLADTSYRRIMHGICTYATSS